MADDTPTTASRRHMLGFLAAAPLAVAAVPAVADNGLDAEIARLTGISERIDRCGADEEFVADHSDVCDTLIVARVMHLPLTVENAKRRTLALRAARPEFLRGLPDDIEGQVIRQILQTLMEA